jgi:protein-tyrosine-phosphatase
LGATKGNNLFDGTLLTAKYFFDALGARFAGSLTYRRIEGAGDIEKHPTALQEAKAEAQRLVTPYLDRKRILFLCRDNARLSQMAGAFARFRFGDRFEVDSAGTVPVERTDPVMVEAMEEKGIDMAFKRPRSVGRVISRWKPDMVVSFGCESARDAMADIEWREWALSASVESSLEGMRIIRDMIEAKVMELIQS